MGNIVVAHLGARMHYCVPEIFQQSGQLAKFYTDLYSGKLVLPALLTNKITALRKLQGRKSDRLPNKKIIHFPYLGFRYAYRLRKSQNVNEQLSSYIWAGKQFTSKIIRNINWRETGVIYGYNTASLELFTIARQKGVQLVYEQTIAPLQIERQLIEVEEEKFPDWIFNKVSYDNQLLQEMTAREREEMKLADHIVSGSSFVKQAIGDFLPGMEEKCSVIPYGVRMGSTHPGFDESHNRPLRVLVAGTLGLRKGTPYVLQLAKRLGKEVTIRIVGNSQNVPEAIMKQICAYCDFRGLVPRSEMHEHYEWADVFLLPSVCEGSATVTYEAMQFGLPLVVTPNTGAFIEHEKEGIFVPVGDVEAMCNAIEKLKNVSYRRSLHMNVISGYKNLSDMAYSERLLTEMAKWGYLQA
jgi:Glycosyltransferase